MGKTIALNTSRASTDLIATLRLWPLWIRLGWKDVTLRYRRTVIGPLWLTLSNGLLIGTLGFLYAQLFDLPLRAYLPYLSAGFITWIMLSGIVVESCTAFTASEQIIKSTAFPYFVFVFRVIWRNLLVFGHNIIIPVAVAVAFGIWPSWHSVLFAPALVLIALNGLWIGTLIGMISTRFRDVPPLVASIMQIVLFITPIFWQSQQLEPRARFISDFNVIHHFIEIVRAPLLAEPAATVSWLVAGGTTVVGLALAGVVYARFKARIPYWL